MLPFSVALVSQLLAFTVPFRQPRLLSPCGTTACRALPRFTQPMLTESELKPPLVQPDTEPMRVDVDRNAAVSESSIAGWGTTEVAVGSALFLALHFCSLSLTANTLDLLEFPDPAASRIGFGMIFTRLVSVSMFVGVQQLAGLLTSEWLTRPSPHSDEQLDLPAPLLPFAAVVLLLAISAIPIGLAFATGEPELARTLLPAPRAFPPVGRALDLLLIAPVAEEVVFRAWLLTACEKAGWGASSSLALSTVLFGLWHGGDSLLLFSLLGAGLGLLYQRSGGRLELAIATHVLWNLAIVLTRVALL